MRLLITGASGDLGRPLSRLARRHSWPLISTYFSNPRVGGGVPTHLDLCNRKAVLTLVSRESPTVIVHAAVSDRSYDMAQAHRLAAKHIAEAANLEGAKLITLSSDMVFDGTKAPYSETSTPTPTSAYGEIKAEVEEYFREAVPTCLIIRTSLIYEFAPENRQVSWMTGRIASGNSVPLFLDEVRHPIHAENLAECLLELCVSDLSGILQIAGPNPLSRAEYGSSLLEIMGYSSEHVEHVLAAEVSPDRPRNLTLNLDKALRSLQTPLRSIQQAASYYSIQGQRTETTTSR